MKVNEYRRAVERSIWGITAEELAAALIAAGPRPYRDLHAEHAAERGRGATPSPNPWRIAALGYGILVATRQGCAGGICGAIRGIRLDKLANTWAHGAHASLAWVAHEAAEVEWDGQDPGTETWVMFAVDGRHVNTVPAESADEVEALLREAFPSSVIERRPWARLPW